MVKLGVGKRGLHQSDPEGSSDVTCDMTFTFILRLFHGTYRH